MRLSKVILVRVKRARRSLQPRTLAKACQVDVVILEHFWVSPSRARTIGKLSWGNQKYMPLAALQCVSEPRLLGRWRTHH